MDFHLIIVAAGSGSRLGRDIPKQYLPLGTETILSKSIKAFKNIDGLQSTCVVISPEHEQLFTKSTQNSPNISYCYGGKERKDSVSNALNNLDNVKDKDIVLIHDAARPFVSKQEITSLIDALKKDYSAATLALPVSDTLRYGNKTEATDNDVSRNNLWAIQTPQAFRYGTLKQAHEQARKKENKDKNFTDDTSIISAIGIPVKFVQGSRQNFKITYAQDLTLAQQLIQTETRTGTGFDVHAFDDTKNISTIKLCGIDIPHNKQLKGHSDADVALHTITDALLGAVGEGDIGLHFPPSNNDFKDMDSSVFLKHALNILHKKGGAIINIDLTIICERPKLGEYRNKMKKRIAEILNTNPARINVKATTTEKLGFTGRQEGIAAQASVNISLPKEEI